MTNIDQLMFEALLTLSIPNAGESVSVTIKLTPADVIPADGISKRLSDCTIADLQSYADALEKEVWETYESISLIDLDNDESVVVALSLPDEVDGGVSEWADKLIVLEPLTAKVHEEPEEEPTKPTDETGEEDATTHKVDELTESEADVQEREDPEPEQIEESIPSPEVSVAETEPVFPDIDEELIEIEGPSEIARPPVPEIIPSKARVRVAGKQLPIGHPTWTAVDILMDEPALRQAQAHALSSLHREVAGVLIGPRPEKQPDGRYLVHIFDTIIAKHTVMQGASVTYTPESWRYLNDTLHERYPDDTAVMVGWYHTHPGFGIFLSGMDMFIHQNFFTQIWHVAMVLDPRAKTSGFFCWDRQKQNVNRVEFSWPKWSASSW